MKKKTIIILCIVLALALFTPVPTGIYKDGGTREYTSLTYKIVDWNRLGEEGKLFTGVKFYPFPYNFLSVSRLYEREMRSEKAVPLDFKAEIVRTDLCGNERSHPRCRLVTSKIELSDYYDGNRVLYQYDNTDIKSIFDRYDDEFFESGALILACLEEGSGSIRHEVQSVEIKNGETFVNVHRKVPEAGTCDMAYWTVIIEVEREKLRGDITVLIDGVNPLTAPALVSFGNEFWNIEMKLPKNWVREETEDGYGIRFCPEGERGFLTVSHLQGGFGVCGTGLTEKETTVGKYQARAGSYSDFKNWDFVYLLDTAGDYVVLNNDGAYWINLYAEELEGVFESLSVGPKNAITPSKAEEIAKSAVKKQYETVYATFDSKHGEYIVKCYDRLLEEGEMVFMTYEGKIVLAGGYNETKEYSDNHACYYPTVDYFTDSSGDNG